MLLLVASCPQQLATSGNLNHLNTECISPIPCWWLAIVLAAAIGAVAYASIAARSPPSRVQRGVPVSLRVLTLAAIVLFLFRLIAILPPAGSREAIVPVLVDGFRSMRLADADGQTRIARERAPLKNELGAPLSTHFTTEIYSVGDGLTPAKVDSLNADARQTDLAGALAAVRERYRGQRVAGIVVLSDGADTGTRSAATPSEGTVDRTATEAGGPPVFAIGIGSPDGPHDREVLGMTAGDPRLDQASVDLHVTAVSTGFGRTPFVLRMLGNGQVLDTRRIVPTADGSPINQLFTVSPDPLSPTVYTADIPRDGAEAVAENNTRSVLVSPAGRKRRLLIVEGAPGFEHSFMTRAWTEDPGLEVDSVTRKGKNGDGVDTFFVQAGSGRSAALTAGFPARRDQLCIRCGGHRERRKRLLFPGAARDARRLRLRAGWRPVGAWRPLLCPARPFRHAP